MKLGSIQVVLVNTTHSGNIGGVARAMKNMGLSRLVLVEPQCPFPTQDAVARASGADDLLEKATIVSTLEEAIADSHLIFGTSARGRHIPWPIMDPHEAAGVIAQTEEKLISIVFGREDRGLTNEELQLCHHHVHIPSNEEFSSLNVAAAVQVLAYECRMAFLKGKAASEQAPQWGTPWDIDLAEQRELELLFKHMEDVLVDIDFLDPENPRQLMPRLRRLFQRAVPDKVEVNILRGVLSHVSKNSRKS